MNKKFQEKEMISVTNVPEVYYPTYFHFSALTNKLSSAYLCVFDEKVKTSDSLLKPPSFDFLSSSDNVVFAIQKDERVQQAWADLLDLNLSIMFHDGFKSAASEPMMGSEINLDHIYVHRLGWMNAIKQELSLRIWRAARSADEAFKVFHENIGGRSVVSELGKKVLRSVVIQDAARTSLSEFFNYKMRHYNCHWITRLCCFHEKPNHRMENIKVLLRREIPTSYYDGFEIIMTEMKFKRSRSELQNWIIEAKRIFSTMLSNEDFLIDIDFSDFSKFDQNITEYYEKQESTITPLWLGLIKEFSLGRDSDSGNAREIMVDYVECYLKSEMIASMYFAARAVHLLCYWTMVPGIDIDQYTLWHSEAVQDSFFKEIVNMFGKDNSNHVLPLCGIGGGGSSGKQLTTPDKKEFYIQCMRHSMKIAANNVIIKDDIFSRKGHFVLLEKIIEKFQIVPDS